MKVTAILCLAVATTLAASIQRRGVIAPNAVKGFTETVPVGAIGQLYLKYKPYLKVEDGCVPFPAVDSSGNTNGGLEPTGSPSGGCSSSTGQVYARSETHGGSFAIMYSWYMPKDSPLTNLGHRHDWENIVVWLSDATPSGTLLGIAASAHGDYDRTRTPNLKGTSPLLRYFSIYPLNYQLAFTTAVGGQQPLIAWESLPAAAQTALANANFGSANVPFKDGNFAKNLDKAKL